MGEETSDAINLDLNLGPGPEPASATMSNEPVNLENWIDQQPMHQIPEVFGISPFRRRWPQPEAHNVWSELNQLMVDSGTSSILQAGEGSVAAEERSNDVPKKCENINGILENETTEEKDDVEKSSGNDGSFESLRQTIQRNAFTFPVEEMIQRLGSRFDLSRDLVQPTEDTPRETAAERTNGLLNRILTSRALRREQIQLAQTEIVDLTQDNITSLDTGDNRRLQSMLLRRTQSHRATLSSLSSALSSAERLVEAYFHNHPITPAVRNQEPPPPVDDRDSFSSIQAVINSESQMDTAVEIDSMVSLSTSSSRRRNEASRVSDMDSGDSRAPRRRRLN
ncbi:uncharacterized protein LOC133721542 [Rosa rugosa]|uniref:uncharacterized protein LOC133721542 n=1 Tax=Rosa rugosa TaxID=74645 RepID=UPI002B40374D|nr:uncharacterized protein LOC133721542 [Rosa rugosa]